MRGKAKKEEEKPVVKKGAYNKKPEAVTYPPPTRSRSSYTLYFSEVRPQFAKDHPTTQPKDIMRAIGKKWQTLSEEEKKPYDEMAERDKERYERQLSEYDKEGRYYDDHGNVVVAEKRGTKKKAEPMTKVSESEEEPEEKKPAKKKVAPPKKKKY
jgi:hypothetical protein